ncbi:MAG TPA: hypothetical protein VFW40_11830 [Capsulimonadaceae bacterium]|nr:hypothetical protein [Capsulimonadaceae bacterium]
METDQLDLITWYLIDNAVRSLSASSSETSTSCALFVVIHFLTIQFNRLLATGRHYGVDPVGFAILDVAPAVLFWFAAAWLVAAAKRRRALHAPALVAFALFNAPYFYLIACGRHVPWYAYPLLLGMMVFSGFFTVRGLRRRVTRIRAVV